MFQNLEATRYRVNISHMRTFTGILCRRVLGLACRNLDLSFSTLLRSINVGVIVLIKNVEYIYEIKICLLK